MALVIELICVIIKGQIWNNFECKQIPLIESNGDEKVI